MTKLYKSRTLGLIYLLPMLVVFLVFGLILCFISNIGFNAVDSDYVIGGFYVSTYNHVTNQAVKSILQLNLFSTFFIFSFFSIFLSVTGRILEIYLTNKVLKQSEEK